MASSTSAQASGASASAQSALVSGSAGSTGIGLLGAAIAVTVWGGSGVIAKWLPMGALAIVVYRFASYSIIVGATRAMRGQRLSWKDLWQSLPAGLLLAADVALFFSAIKLTSVVNATIIGSLQPLLLTAYGVRFLGETVKRRDISLGCTALAGVIVIVTAGGDRSGGDLTGNLLAIGALLAWSAYFVVAKKVNAGMSSANFTISTAIIVAVTNLPLALAFGQSMAWPSLEHWAWLLGMALGAGILGHNLMNWSIVRIPLWLGSTFTLLVPVVSSALAWMFLDEPLTAAQVVAMFVTVVALSLLVWYQQQDERREATK